MLNQFQHETEHNKCYVLLVIFLLRTPLSKIILMKLFSFFKLKKTQKTKAELGFLRIFVLVFALNSGE